MIRYGYDSWTRDGESLDPETLKPEEVRAFIDGMLADYDVDPDCSHAVEDDLAELVMRAIHAGADAVGLSGEMIRLYDTDRVRWYA